MADDLSHAEGMIYSASDAEEVTPSDSVDLSQVSRGLYVGGSGDISVVMKDGTTVTLKSVVAGSVLPVRVSRVRATSTTATDIVALY